MNDIELIQNKIYEIRGQRVMLDFDLAEMYAVETRMLNQAVKRNIERFPPPLQSCKPSQRKRSLDVALGLFKMIYSKTEVS